MSLQNVLLYFAVQLSHVRVLEPKVCTPSYALLYALPHIESLQNARKQMPKKLQKRIESPKKLEVMMSLRIVQSPGATAVSR